MEIHFDCLKGRDTHLSPGPLQPGPPVLAVACKIKRNTTAGARQNHFPSDIHLPRPRFPSVPTVERNLPRPEYFALLTYYGAYFVT